MTFDLTPSQKGIRKAAREFARGEFDRNLVAAWDKQGAFPEKIWKKAARLGLIGIHMDPDHSGGAFSMVDHVLAVQALCAVDSGVGASVTSACRGAEYLYLAGDEALRERYLEPVLSGKKISGLAVLETGGEVNGSGLATTAVPENGEFILNGRKEYVLHGPLADYFIVLCNTPSENGPELKPSLIVIDGESPGIEVAPLGEKLGWRMSPLAHVVFTNARVPLSNMIGTPGTGQALFDKVLSVERVSRAAMGVGIARGAFDRSVAYTRTRQVFGKSLAGFQVTRHKLAEMAVEIRAAELLTLEAAARIEKGSYGDPSAATALLMASRAAVRVADEAVQLLGGYGYMAEYEVERFYRDAKTIEISHPAGFGLKNLLAEQLMGPIKSA